MLCKLIMTNEYRLLKTDSKYFDLILPYEKLICFLSVILTSYVSRGRANQKAIERLKDLLVTVKCHQTTYCIPTVSPLCNCLQRKYVSYAQFVLTGVYFCVGVLLLCLCVYKFVRVSLTDQLRQAFPGQEAQHSTETTTEKAQSAFCSPWGEPPLHASSLIKACTQTSACK